MTTLRSLRQSAAPTPAEERARRGRPGPRPPDTGLTLLELARRYDAARGSPAGTTTPVSIYRWERGEHAPQQPLALSRALGVPLCDVRAAIEETAAASASLHRDGPCAPPLDEAPPAR